MSNTKNKKIVFPIILGLVLVGAIGFSLKEYFYYKTHEVTDNAQIDADISPVVARVGSYVKEIRFKDNQYVKAGDTLVILDDRDLKIKLLQAEADLKLASQQINVSQSAITETASGMQTINANIEAAKVRLWKATEDYKRFKNLFDEHAITKAQFDAVKAEKDAAESALSAVQSQAPVLNSRVNTTKEQAHVTAVNTDRKVADVEYAKLQLSYTVITAPVSGIVSKRNIEVGQLVQAGQSLFAVVDDHNLYVTANFKETQMEHLHPGEKVNITIDAFPDKKIEGVIESFSGATGAKFSLLPPDNATGNFVKVVQRLPVRITLHAEQEFLKLLRPGMSVKAEVFTN